MRRIELAVDKAPHFIGAWGMQDPALCDEIIAFFEANEALQRTGATGAGVNAAIKKSTDITVKPRDLQQASHAVLNRYMQELHACYQDYLAQWPFLANMLKESDIGDFNIQRYYPSEHFAATHSERTTIGSAHRVLVWMTYLNDVDAGQGGETRFDYYGLEVKPERGKTLIWPAEWTHAHSGKVVTAGTKYIITGWMHFAPPAGKP